MTISQLCMVELWFECFEYYPYIQMWQYMLVCGVGAKPVAHLMKYHLLQWEVAKVKPLMISNMTLTVLNLHEKTSKGATIKIQIKRYERYKRDKIANVISKLNFYELIPYPMDNCSSGQSRLARQTSEKDVLCFHRPAGYCTSALARWHVILPSCLESMTS